MQLNCNKFNVVISIILLYEVSTLRSQSERECDIVLNVKCVGLPIEASVAMDGAECKQECTENDRCEFFTFDHSNFVCTLFDECPGPENCNTCVTGHCPFPTTITTIRTTTIDPNPFKRVMVVGGANQDGFLADVEYFDPFDANVQCAKPPNFPYERDGMVGEFVNNKPHICGGWNGEQDVNECFTLEPNQEWREFSSLLDPRGFTSDILIETGENHDIDSWWLTGGFTSSNTTEILFSYEDHFVSATGLPEDMHYHCMSNVNSSHIFLAGSNYGSGRQAYLIDTSNHKNFVFYKLPDMSFRHYGAACFTAQIEGEQRLVVAGGHPNDKTTEYYSFSSGEWEEGATLPRGFFSGGYITYPGDEGTILIGGIDKNDAYHNDILWFNEEGKGAFETLPVRLTTARWNFGVLLTQSDIDC